MFELCLPGAKADRYIYIGDFEGSCEFDHLAWSCPSIDTAGAKLTTHSFRCQGDICDGCAEAGGTLNNCP
ncbi:uncharacterized protein PSFLO_03587 [Pseudozyma flocculosa]|uniref:Uncharacterized protein n=1 Tax=Pseudozyma flocculosa TaxID=84751 RepID=A0A5C3F218_9BASI|nr:uncharacterized protein PSFLO_03587 [Pseudozyma flocculosa]